MNAGFSGTYVISWAQTELDGQSLTPMSMLRTGMEWRWSGRATRVDGPADILRLCDAAGEAELRHRVRQRIQKRSGCGPSSDQTLPGTSPASGFTVTDGRGKWDIDFASPDPAKSDLLICVNGLPPPDCDLWVVSHSRLTISSPPHTSGVICFTPGTLIQTQTGPRPVEHLVQGDSIQSKDNGCQEVLWIGNRHLTGARLYAEPHLRPIHFPAGTLDQNIPDPGLTVSPDHRIVLRGPRARALFNDEEVLVRARDLVNDHRILADHTLREVTYIHLLLPAHQIVFANGVETESFHPAGARLETVQWAEIDARIADLHADPYAYGPHARRALTQSEAAIFRHDLH